MPKMMKLGLLMHTGGQHVAAWRHPDGNPAAGFDMAYYRHLAATAERGRLDFLFVADILGLRDGPIEAVTRSAQLTFVAEPLTLMASLAAVTEKIGLVVTASTTYSQPFAVARQMASLDLVSGGRAGWNVVTPTQNSEASNFGLEMIMDHSERYERAAEFVAAVHGLWASAAPGLFVGDKASGFLFDPDKVRPYRHDGRFFRLAGVLNVPPSPQGRPVVVQAGASGPGRELAAAVAEIVFVQAATIEGSTEYRTDVRSRAEAVGRYPGDLVVMPGIIPVIASTRAEAEASVAELDALIDPALAVAFLGEVLGVPDLGCHPLDGPLPPIDLATNKSKTAVEAIVAMAEAKRMSIRDVATWVVSSMGHNRVAGTAEDIADVMQQWFEAGACDGFLVSPMILREDLKSSSIRFSRSFSVEVCSVASMRQEHCAVT